MSETTTAEAPAVEAAPTAATGPAPAPVGRPGLLLAGSYLASAVGAMALATLLAAYVSFRDRAGGDWIPDDVDIPNMAALTLTITLAMSVVTAGWVVASARVSDRRGVLFGAFLTILLGLAHLNGLAFVLGDMGLVAAESTHAAVTYAIVGLHTAFVIAGLAALVATIVRGAGGQLVADRHEVATATFVLWTFVVVAWAAVYVIVFLVK